MRVINNISGLPTTPILQNPSQAPGLTELMIRTEEQATVHWHAITNPEQAKEAMTQLDSLIEVTELKPDPAIDSETYRLLSSALLDKYNMLLQRTTQQQIADLPVHVPGLLSGALASVSDMGEDHNRRSGYHRHQVRVEFAAADRRRFSVRPGTESVTAQPGLADNPYWVRQLRSLGRYAGYQREIRAGVTANSVIAEHGLANDPRMAEQLRSFERNVRNSEYLRERHVGVATGEGAIPRHGLADEADMVAQLRTIERRVRNAAYLHELRAEGATAEAVIARHGLANDATMVAHLRTAERHLRYAGYGREIYAGSATAEEVIARHGLDEDADIVAQLRAVEREARSNGQPRHGVRDF